jgi:hypothetical protein
MWGSAQLVFSVSLLRALSLRRLTHASLKRDVFVAQCSGASPYGKVTVACWDRLWLPPSIWNTLCLLRWLHSASVRVARSQLPCTVPVALRSILAANSHLSSFLSAIVTVDTFPIACCISGIPCSSDVIISVPRREAPHDRITTSYSTK